ncbi:predicted protein [Nematostella vectensis]|uniref:Large ribosomal subunit protein bL33m n=1 Tax=Nematostella vectensis TaxID=45351 RepID=A7RP07_NEMVE|nr:predicted protein [Nematostella vectensis]|eukprot:XP_001638834.1 predicted protein [Nematostella vectensis]
MTYAMFIRFFTVAKAKAKLANPTETPWNHMIASYSVISPPGLFSSNRTLIVRLVSMAGTGYFYTMTRNRLKDKLQLMKYDPVVRQHVLFTEQKVKKGKKG